MKTLEILKKENKNAVVFEFAVEPMKIDNAYLIERFARDNDIHFKKKCEYNYITYVINGLNVMLRYSKKGIDIWCKYNFKGAEKFERRNQYHKRFENVAKCLEFVKNEF